MPTALSPRNALKRLLWLRAQAMVADYANEDGDGKLAIMQEIRCVWGDYRAECMNVRCTVEARVGSEWTDTLEHSAVQAQLSPR